MILISLFYDATKIGNFAIIEYTFVDILVLVTDLSAVLILLVAHFKFHKITFILIIVVLLRFHMLLFSK